jgi:hypothetical protein
MLSNITNNVGWGFPPPLNKVTMMALMVSRLTEITVVKRIQGEKGRKWL